MADLGTDIYCVDDIDPAFAIVSGTRALSQAIARRLSTPRGALFYDLDYGFDLTAFLNADIDDRLLFQIGVGVENEARKDERVRDATATVTYDKQTEKLSVVVQGSASDGPFQLILSVDAVTVDILRDQ
jgi:phage baseplate assembly protein W